MDKVRVNLEDLIQDKNRPKEPSIKEIEEIIDNGTGKDKIKLYFEDLAYFNIYYKSFLEHEHRLIILNTTKSKPEIKYYNELRVNFNAFLMFYPRFSTYQKEIYYIGSQISKDIEVIKLHKTYRLMINMLIDKIEDISLRVKITEDLKEEFNKNIENTELVNKGIDKLNEELEEFKEFLEGIRLFINKHLALKTLKLYIKNIEAFIMAVEKDIKEALSTINIDSNKILSWKDIKTDITEEDLENIKSAGR